MAFLYSNFSLDNITIRSNKLCSSYNYLIDTCTNPYYKEGIMINEYRRGKYKNLQIKEDLRGQVTYIKGSIATFINGNNANSIPFDLLLKHILRIGEYLGFTEQEMLESELLVKNLEYGLTFEVNQSCSVYNNSIIDYKGRANNGVISNMNNRSKKPINTKYIYNKTWELYFYDKKEELKKNKKIIPSNWNTKNMLKIEKRCLTSKALDKKFLIKDIETTTFQEYIKEDFLKTYNKIIFSSDGIDYNKYSFEESLILDNPNPLNLLKLNYSNGGIQEATYKRKHALIVKLLNQNPCTYRTELDNKINKIMKGE